MSNVVDTLIVELKAETKKLRTELDKVHKKLDKTKKKSDGVGKALKVMGGVVATIGLGKLASETVQTIRTFEDLEATLRAVTGGADGAAVSFEVIREFTKGTTFQIDEVAEAFIRLKQAGVVPTSEVLQDFGNLSAARETAGGASSATRGVFMGGYTSPGDVDVIEYITIATTGDAQDFGNLSAARRNGCGVSNNIRGLYAGGFPAVNTIEFVTIATTGDANDFGDLHTGRLIATNGASDSHGGIS